MALVNAYCEVAELQHWMSDNDLEPPDAEIAVYEAAINATCRWIDWHCKRYFFQVQETRYFAADDPYNIVMGHYGDIVEITALATDEDGDGVYETSWTVADDIQLRPVTPTGAPEPKPFRSIYAVGARSFPIASSGLFERVEAVGTWGWPDARPDAVHQASLIQGARIVKRMDAPAGVAGINQFGVVRVSRYADPDVIALLGGYRLRSVG